MGSEGRKEKKRHGRKIREHSMKVPREERPLPFVDK